ncbi:uncharacterized protein CDAR_169461 [Caerostris darwini]|uniref:BMP and activin membrane-bound inhibitor N-terminal domain-containing protein n=1 Tax=Caerostris darwini TaxID=1538125 RepID=A0AAV4RUI5_9ARAC|nr:uncharacterized protein CDAR_169461 [Caerostris darwini]
MDAGLTDVGRQRYERLKTDVRCYCNLPACVTSGYMCKSSAGVCVSDHFGFNGDLWQSRHACMELLNDEDQPINPLKCPQTFPDVVLDSGTYPAHSVAKGRHVQLFPQRCGSSRSCLLSNDDYFYRHGGNNNRNNASVHEQMWFKAAVIAVAHRRWI